MWKCAVLKCQHALYSIVSYDDLWTKDHNGSRWPGICDIRTTKNETIVCCVSKIVEMGRGKTISPEIRNIIVNLAAKGESQRAIAKTLDLSRNSVNTILRHYNQTNSIDVKPRSGRPRQISSRDERALADICRKNRRKSSKEVRAMWNEVTGMELSVTSTIKTINKLGYGFYKVCVLSCS